MSSNEVRTSSGLAIWSNSSGIMTFPGGGLSLDALSHDGVATALLFDPESQSLFVSGVFARVNNTISCSSIVVWNDITGRWKCLYDHDFSFDLITSMLYVDSYLYIAGIPSTQSTWDNFRSPYMIARYQRQSHRKSSDTFGGTNEMRLYKVHGYKGIEEEDIHSTQSEPSGLKYANADNATKVVKIVENIYELLRIRVGSGYPALKELLT